MTADEPLDLFDVPVDDPDEPDQASGPDVWEVSEINAAVRALLEDALPPVWIRGEVANWTRARSGHCYFTIKDERAQLRCVMWRTRASRLPTDPDEGMRIRVMGRLTLYEARGEYQLGVEQLHAEGEDGLWKLAFEKLRRQLEDEGLLDPSRKRPIPRFPGTVGVVTSTTGAALRDILSVIGRRAPWTRVVVRGARVQGEGAASEIARALRELVAAGGVDVVIVGRGGGSIEDLWAFNEEPVARAIAECPVPVISAVGHETDVTISDLVADLRAPTPSAAGEAAVQDRAGLAELLGAFRTRCAGGLRRQLRRRQDRIGELRPRIFRAMDGVLQPRRAVLEGRAARLGPAMRRQLAPRRVRIGHDRERLGRTVRRLIEARREHLARAAGQIEALSPLSALRRGYAVPLGTDGGLLRGTSDFEPGMDFDLRVVDGRVRARVERVSPAPELTTIQGDSTNDE